MTTRVLFGGALGALILTLSACGGSAPAPEHQVLGPGADSLRAAFNAGEGKVRALFLASPT